VEIVNLQLKTLNIILFFWLMLKQWNSHLIQLGPIGADSLEMEIGGSGFDMICILGIDFK
jgi:hypothetical protein